MPHYEIEDDHDHHQKPIPKAILISVGLLIGFTLLVIILDQNTDWFDDGKADPVPVETVLVTIATSLDGTVTIRDPDGTELVQYDPAHSGFLQGVLRALKRHRDRAEVAYSEPYAISRFSDGRVRLVDPQTTMTIDVRSFGPTNAATIINAFRASRAQDAN